MSEFQQGAVRLSQLATRFTAWIGSLDVDALIDRSALAREYAFILREAQRQAAHLMTPAEEALATELNVTGGNAWNRLYNNAASQLLVSIEIEGQPPSCRSARCATWPTIPIAKPAGARTRPS